MADRGILRLELDQLVFGPADLQHIGVLAGIDAIVAVLLAAELGQCSAQTVMRLQDLGRLLRCNVRSRQLHTVHERGVGHGIPGWFIRIDTKPFHPKENYPKQIG